jgi:hypothetical protein
MENINATIYFDSKKLEFKSNTNKTSSMTTTIDKNIDKSFETPKFQERLS